MIHLDNTPHEVIQQLLDDLARIRALSVAVDREVEENGTASYDNLKPHPMDVYDELDAVHRDLSNWLLRNDLDAVPRRGDMSRAPGDTPLRQR